MDLEVKSFTVERKKRPVTANEVLLVFFANIIHKQ